MCAQSVLGASTFAVQPFADVTLPMGNTRPVSCFFLTVGLSGERKSAVDADALWPVTNREKALRDRYDEELPLWSNQSEAWEKQRAQILAHKTKYPTQEAKYTALTELGQAPAKPLAPILTASEPTLEGLHKLFSVGHASLGLFSAEGGSFVGGHGMTSEKKLLTATGLSDLWDGTPIRRVRSGDGASVLPGRRLAAHLMMQPDIAGAILSDRALADQGLLSRFLIASPASTIGTRFWRETTPENDADIRRYWAQISQILETPPRMAEGALNELAPRALKLAPAARALCIRFMDNVERMTGKGGEMAGISGLANKLPEHATRLAAVLCLSGDVEADAVSGEHMAAGIEIAEHYAAEAMRLHFSGMVDSNKRQALDALHWLQTAWPENHISLPDLYQRGPVTIREKAKAKAVVSILEDHGWLHPVANGATINGQFRRDAWLIVEA